MSKLVEDYLPLAKSIANKSIVNYPYLEHEIESAACLGLLEAAQNFDKVTIKFATYARQIIQFRILDLLRAEKLRNQEIKDYYLTNYECKRRDIFILTSSERVAESLLQLDALQSITKLVPKNIKEVLELFYFHNLEERDIAKKLKISQTNVNRLKKLGIELLKDYLNASAEKERRSVG